MIGHDDIGFLRTTTSAMSKAKRAEIGALSLQAFI